MPRTKHNKGKVEASVPRTKHDKGKVEGQKLRIQEILGTLGAPSTPLNEVLPVDSRDNATTAVPESGAPIVPSLQISYGVLITHTFSTSILQLADVWSDARSLCTNSPP